MTKWPRLCNIFQKEFSATIDGYSEANLSCKMYRGVAKPVNKMCEHPLLIDKFKSHLYDLVTKAM